MGDGSGEAPDPWRAAALLRAPLLDDGARQETEGTAAAMVDSAAATESDRLGEALVELEADGVSYGEATLTVALHGELGSIERLDATCVGCSPRTTRR